MPNPLERARNILKAMTIHGVKGGKLKLNDLGLGNEADRAMAKSFPCVDPTSMRVKIDPSSPGGSQACVESGCQLRTAAPCKRYENGVQLYPPQVTQ